MVNFIVFLFILGGLVGWAVLTRAVIGWRDAEVQAERLRIEREAVEASWRIHRQATATFARMLSSAREQHQEPES